MGRPHRTVALLLVVTLILSSCSQAARVPQSELTSGTERTGLHRIQTVDDQFVVQRFAVTDSTINILEFAETDGRYGRAELPVVIDLDDVKSVEKISTDNDHGGLILWTVAIVGIVVLVAHLLIGASGEGDI